MGDQSLTVKGGNVKPYSNAEKAGLKTMDYIWQINGKEVFELGHNDCVNEIKNAGTSLSLATERGDHIVPNFEEIWPSKKGGKKGRPMRGILPRCNGKWTSIIRLFTHSTKFHNCW